MPAFAGMTIGGWLPLLFILSGCHLLMGESYTERYLRDPKTGTTVTCAAYVGRGGPTQAEIDTMRACAAWYESKGYVPLD